MKKITEEYKERFFSTKGTNNKAKIGIRTNDGEVKAMTVEQVFNAYFVGNEIGELKMLMKLKDLGADVKDIIHILEIYNEDYNSDKYRFNEDQWESDKNSKTSQKERENHKVNTIISSQNITDSVYRDLRQMFFLEKFHKGRIASDQDPQRIFMKGRHKKLEWIEGRDYRNKSNTKTRSEKRFDDMGIWLEKYKKSTEKKGMNNIKIYRTMDRKEFEGICRWFKKYKEDCEKKKEEKKIEGNLNFTDPVSKKNVHDEVYTGQVGAPIPIKNHLGGYSQAKHYAMPDNDYKFLVQFTLNISQKQLLTYQYLALQEASSHSTIGMIAEWLKKNNNKVVIGSREEGSKRGYIGLKNEEHGNEALSISLGGSKDTRELFQNVISRIDLIEVIPVK